MTHRIVSWSYRITNRMLHTFGLRLQRIDAPTRTFQDFFGHLREVGIDFRTVIDVGVARGTPAIYTAFPRARYIFVEPLVEFRETLEQLSRRLNGTFVLAAAGARDGEIEMHVHEDLSGSSVLPQAEGPAFDGVGRRVPLVRLDGILPAVVERPCLLKLDTQGNELEVIEGLGQRLAEIDVLLIEASLLAFRKRAPQLADLVTRLDQLDFVVYDILEGHVRPLDGALAQVDLAFVAKTGGLRSDPRFFSDEQLERYMRGFRRARP